MIDYYSSVPEKQKPAPVLAACKHSGFITMCLHSFNQALNCVK